jgi:hypothetical protein
MRVLELRGQNSYYATMAVHKLIFGLKMLPTYGHETYAEFCGRLDEMSEKDQEMFLREAALFVKLEPDELLDVIQFCVDANGVPYSKENMKSMSPEVIHEIVVAVAKEVVKAHKIRLISEDEKKN